ncbi:hypothetical protein [Caldivirga sp. UBA161]|uniref:hypothetical protein n=1 Tax=Caldivirga sp. UBA161 TaxID=1915569 RepID=UPI0025C1507D|nr:hypothetical protein [Caldivirga sp. UBA161]
MGNPYEALGFVDRPLNPSGLPPMVRRYVTMGLEREVGEVMKAVEVFLRGSDNILLVVVGPYGFGKSDLLDDVEGRLKGLNVEVVRAALSLSMNIKDYLISKFMNRNPSKPMIIMFDEADELTRAASMSGGVSSEVKNSIMQVTGLIRAILEPRSYASLLNLKPSDLSRVMIIAAFTPQLYYSILKNNVPDVFDIARGRVFKEVTIDDRVPYWLYEAIIENRLLSYSTPEKLKAIKDGELNPLHPFNRESLSLIYLIARRMENGQASPRNLIKLTSKLFEMIVENNGQLTVNLMIRFLTSELGKYINLNLLNELRTYGDELMHVALSGIPVMANPSVELTGLVEKVKVIEVNPENASELRAINNLRMVYGKPPIVADDLRNLSIEYGSYYTVPIDKGIKLIVILPAEADAEGFITHEAYVLKKSIHDKLLGLTNPETSSLDELSNLIRQVAMAKPIDVASRIISIITKSEPIKTQDGLRIVIADNALDARLAYIVLTSPEGALGIAANCGVRVNGQVRHVDGLIGLIVNDQLLTSQLQGNLNVKWCGVYDASQRILLINYGSDNVEELRGVLIGLYVLSKFSKIPSEYASQVQSATRFIERISAFRDSLRNQLLQYTLGLPRRREGKRDAIRSLVKGWVDGTIDQSTPPAFKCGDKPCISRVEATLVNYLSNLKRPIDEKELEYVIRGLFPIQLWRDFREHDLIDLMKLRGLLFERNGKYVVAINGEFNEAVNEACSRVRELAKLLNGSASISIDNINLTLQTGFSTLQGEVKELEEECKLLTTVISNPTEDELKRLAKINLSLMTLQDKVNEVKENEGRLINEIKNTISNLNSLINSLNNPEVNVDNAIKDVVRGKVKELQETVIRAMSNLNGLSIDKAYEALKSLNDNVSKEVNRLRRELELSASILHYAHEHAVMALILTKAFQLTGNGEEIPPEDNITDSIIELLSKDALDDLETVLSEYESRVKEARGRLIDIISKVKAKATEIYNSVNWLKHKGLINQDLKTPNLDSVNLSELKAGIDELVNINTIVTSRLSELASKLNVPLSMLRYIASMGPNVGLDEVIMARELGMESRDVINYLEALWRAKLVEKRYVS